MSLSFWEMDCLVQQHKAAKLREALNIDPARKAELARRAALVAKNKPQQAAVEPPAPDVSPTDVSPAPKLPDGEIDPATQARIKSAAERVMSKPAAEDEGPVRLNRKSKDGFDPNDPLNKQYGLRGSRGVRGNTNNLSGLEAGQPTSGSGGGGAISRQMDNVSSNKSKDKFLANLTEKLSTTNDIIRNWPTMAFVGKCIAGDFGFGPLAKYKQPGVKDAEGKDQMGDQILSLFAGPKGESLSRDPNLTAPFALALKAGASKGVGKDANFDPSKYSGDGTSEIVIPDPKVMAKVMMKIREFFMGQRDNLKNMPQDAAGIAKAVTGQQDGQEDPEAHARQVMQQKKAARPLDGGVGRTPKAESRDWMDAVELMEHWGF